jgi:hypothetical protein
MECGGGGKDMAKSQLSPLDVCQWRKSDLPGIMP